MKTSELKNFLDKIPEEIKSYQIIYRKFEDEGNNILFLDYPLSTLYIDEENEECIFLDEDGWNYFNNHLLLRDDEDDSNDIVD
jgi:hypothetical protein